MTTVASTNFTPSFNVPNADTDPFDSEMLEIGLAALDGHNHANTKGLAVLRLSSGVDAARPAAGNAGHVYIATDNNRFYFDTGVSWWSVVVAGVSITSTGIQFANNVGKISFVDSLGAVQKAIYSTSGDTLRIYPQVSAGNITFRNFADTLNNVVISDAGNIDTLNATTGNITAKGSMVANSYRTTLQPFAADYLIQTGTATSSNGGEVTVTFTTATPNAGVAFLGTPQVTITPLSAAGATYAPKVAAVSNTSFTFSVYDNANARVNSIPVMWMAMGTR